MNREIYPKVKVILSNASMEAKGFDDNKIRPEHIMLAILMDDDNLGAEILKKMGVVINDFYDVLTDYVRKRDLIPRIGAVRRKLPLSDETKAVIKSLDKECEKMNDNMIDTTHLILSILMRQSPATEILTERYNINYKNFSKKMKEMKGDTNNMFSHDEDETQEPLRRKRVPDGKSKTPVLDNFCRDVTKAVELGEIDPVVGRGTEIKRVSQILARRKKNNPILIGEPGVGKTAIVEGLALLINAGNAPRPLMNKQLYALDLASLVAGTKYRGQFEERMKAVLEECKANPNIILFIDELHTIIGAGNASGSLDASNIFKPALARGELQIIGATTLDEYRENIEKDGALTRRFQQVLVEEPTLEETKTILMNIKETYEKHHKVVYTEEAIDECVKLSARYIMDRAMPDKAIDVMDEAGATTNVNLEKPEGIIKLEGKKLELLERKRAVIANQNYEEAAKIRDTEKKVIKEFDDAMTAWNLSLEQKKTIVDIDLISNVVSMMTGIPLSKISTQESKRLINLDKELSGKVIGQDAAVTKVVKAIKRNRIGIKDKNKPVGSFIFLGPTGVGKTMLAKLLAEQVYGDADALIRMDMSEYMEKHSVSKLVGAPPGYVGYEQGGQLTEKVRRKPHCVVLFDEIEKANEDVFNILLQLLDEGQLTDGLGRKVNFKNALIILTSNIGVTEVNSFGKSLGFETDVTTVNEEIKKNDIIHKALKKKFKPEFLNRIDEAIIFRHLSEEDIHKIIYLEIDRLEARLKENNLKLKVSKDAIEFLGREGYDSTYGARPLARTIQRHVEDGVADGILSGDILEGETINVSLNKTKDAVVIKSSKSKK